MSKIHTLKIENFHWMEKFEQKFNSDFVCLIWRWDSWKTTILKAISYVLYPNWNLSFYDTDFYNCNVDNDIIIEATLYDIPNKLLEDSKFGLYVRWIKKDNWELQDEITDEVIECLTIKLVVDKDLEPKWYVVSNRQDDIEIRYWDRSLFNVFLISDYIDRHFSWNRWTPLYSLLREWWDKLENNWAITESMRKAKGEIDSIPFSKFDDVLGKVKGSARELWLDVWGLSATVDFKEISIKEWNISLHGDKVPFRQKWKWTKRLLSMAIQHELLKEWWIVLIDEIEQWLEPDRVQHLVSKLKKDNKGQIFLTTHSRDVLVELGCNDLYLIKKSSKELCIFSEEHQPLIRTSPESFFAKKILVCEWETEYWLCMSLNNYNIGLGKNNMSYQWVKLVVGKGDNFPKVCRNFRDLWYDVCLFCDSDKEEINGKKEPLKEEGVCVIDWKDSNSLEYAIFSNIGFELAQKLIYLAISIKSKENWEDEDKVKLDIYGNLKWELWEEFPKDLDENNYNASIKKVLWKISSGKNSWFKQIWKWIELWNLIFENYSLLGEENEIKKNFKKLSDWIDGD